MAGITTGKVSIPYSDREEYRECLMTFVDLLLHRLLFDKSSEFGTTRHSGLPVLWRDIEASLRDISPTSIEDEEIWVLGIKNAMQEMAQRVIATKDHGITTFEYVSAAFDLNPFERLALLLSICPYLDRKYEKIFDQLGEYKEVGAPSVGTVAAIYNLVYGFDNVEDRVEMCTGGRRFRLLFESQEEFSGLAIPLVPNKNIVSEALGNVSTDGKISGFCRYFFPNDDFNSPLDPILYGEDTVGELVNLTNNILKDKNSSELKSVVFIRGQVGSGRFFFLQHAMRQLNHTIIELELEKLLNVNDLQGALVSLERDYILHRGLICLRNCTGKNSEHKQAALQTIIERITRFSPLLFVTMTDDSTAVNCIGTATATVIDAKEPSYENLVLILEKYHDLLPFDDDVKMEELAASFRFTPGDVGKLFDIARFEAHKANSPVISMQHIISGTSQLRSNSLGELGDIITCHYTFDDLVTSPKNIEMMKLAVNHMKYRNIVMDKWGFGEKSRYGNNVCVMFYGAPGTGKTMAAQVIANEVGMELFRVDSSQLTSKYIGETSKNIRAVFDGAKGSNVILFFDEADSIFAKRTNQTNDSNDRYANSDTSYLLQKIEDYDGLVLLSTNLLQNIDDAFRRRMTYILNFTKPDDALRNKLWRSFVTENLPHEKIDFDFLSGFDLVGSDIKSIMMSATFMAAGNEDVLKMEYLVHALVNHMQKKGNPLMSSDLKQYASFN